VAPLRLSGAAPCGLWLGLPEVDLIFFEADTSPAHQDHIILHELGHVLSHEHDGTLDEELLRTLFPALSPELVRNALGRTRYSAVEEQEAEVFAHLVLARVRRAPAAAEPARGSTDTHTRDVLRRFARGIDG
jgi:phage-related baseplate assembly protein